MIFSSPSFMFIFLPIVLFFYWCVRGEARVYFLLLISLFYYAWGGVEYLALMALSIVVNFIFGLLVGYFRRPFSRIVTDLPAKVILYVSIFVNLGILFYPKYVTNILLQRYPAGNPLDISAHAPIGVSFFTFSAMAYVFDIYLKKNTAQKNPLKFGLFMTLFPKIMAGPIVRYIDIEQNLAKPSVSFDDIAYGVKRFIIGFGKKS